MPSALTHHAQGIIRGLDVFGQAADRDAIDASLGNRAHGITLNPALGFQQRPSGVHRHCAAQLIRSKVIEQYRDGA